MDMGEKFLALKRLIGDTPLVELSAGSGLYAKLEWHQYGSSIKVRPAWEILYAAHVQRQISSDTIVVESSSGNFGIALALICKFIGLRFVAIVDPNISPKKEALLRSLSHEVFRVTERDDGGGYLLNRLRKVEEFKRSCNCVFHPNQYANLDNVRSYQYGLANELFHSLPNIGFCVAAVSTGGTLTGLSLGLKAHSSNIAIIGVDVEGSLVFGDTPKPRRISGLGSSRKSEFLHSAKVDFQVILTEVEILEGCRELFHNHAILAGPSSGAVYVAAKRMARDGGLRTPGALIFPDSGSDYLEGLSIF